MSEAGSGDLSPTRPGLNVERAASDGSNPTEKQPGKRSRRRWKKRKNRSENGVLADRSDHSLPQQSGVGQVRPNPKPATQQDSANGETSSTPLGTSKNSKRRRRRRQRRHREKNARGPEGAGSELAVSVSVLPEQDRGQTGNQRPEKRENAKFDNRHNRRRVPSQQTDRRKTPAEADGIQNPDRTQPERRNAGQPNRRQHRRRGDAYAALDLGTNNCRLLIAVPQQPGRFKVVDAFSRIVRLGEGLAATGRLREDAMDRAIGALKMCAGKLENRTVKGVRLIATEACRRAANGGDFLDRVRQQTGIDLEIIDRETEARLAVAGCSSLVDRQAKGVVLFDIGGGSSELALLDLSKRKRHDLAPAMVSWTSMPLGVVTLSEKHGGGRVVTREIFENMINDVSQHLVAFEGRNALKDVAEQGEVHLLGTSGTVTTLAGIHLELPRYDRRRVDGTWMASDDVELMINRLVDMTFEQRAANPCIGKDRADLVLAGCAILVAIQRLWPCPRLRVADRGLREGLLTEMMNADNAWQRRPRYFRQKRN